MSPSFVSPGLPESLTQIPSGIGMADEVLLGLSCLIAAGTSLHAARRATLGKALSAFGYLCILWGLLSVSRWDAGPLSPFWTLLLGASGAAGTLLLSQRLVKRLSPSKASIASEFTATGSNGANPKPGEHSGAPLRDRVTALEERCAELEQQCKQLQGREQAALLFILEAGQSWRTSLASIQSKIERQLAEEPDFGEQSYQLFNLGSETRSLLHRLDRTLDTCRTYAGKERVEYSRADLTHLLRALVSHQSVLASDRDIVCRLDLPERLEAEFDVERLHRAFSLLLEEVFRLTRNGGRIDCRLRVETSPAKTNGLKPLSPQARLELEAHGLSFPQALTPLSGQPFVGWTAGVPQSPELGLTWSLIHGVAALHGGDLQVCVETADRCRIHVVIPTLAPPGTALSSPPIPLPAISELSDRKPAVAATQAADLSSAEPASARPLVLVVEDHDELRSMIPSILEHRYRVVSASDGEEGLRLARDLHPDLIISDMVMPRMAGDQMVRQIRKIEALQSVPIILLTARNDEDLRVKMLRNGAHDYVIKPFSSDELLARADNLIRFKRAREVLERELRQQSQDIEALAREVANRKRELEAVVRTLELALEHAERASHIKTNFLRVVSHELRTPLTAMSLEAQLLRRYLRHTLSEREERALDHLDQAMRRLQELIDGLLEYAHVESGAATLRVDALDLASLVQDVAGNWHAPAAAKGLELRCAVPADLPLLQSDEHMLRLILSQLVDNAIKFTAQGFVEIRADYQDRYFTIMVRDTGSGIPMEQRAAIFEPFEHLEPVRSKHTQGMGLGLALVQELLRALGGRIELDSILDGGSVFKVLIPNLQQPDA